MWFERFEYARSAECGTSPSRASSKLRVSSASDSSGRSLVLRTSALVLRASDRTSGSHLQPIPRVVEPTEEEQDPAHLCGERRQIAILLVLLERAEGLLHAHGALVRPAQEKERPAYPRREASGVVAQPLLGEQCV